MLPSEIKNDNLLQEIGGSSVTTENVPVGIISGMKDALSETIVLLKLKKKRTDQEQALLDKSINVITRYNNLQL